MKIVREPEFNIKNLSIILYKSVESFIFVGSKMYRSNADNFSTMA